MEKLQTNKKIKANNNNNKKQQLLEYKKNIKARSQLRKAKFILEIIERNKQNGTPHKKDEVARKKWQAVINKYLKTNNEMNDKSMPKPNVLKGSKADKQTDRNREMKVLRTSKSQPVSKKEFINTKIRRLSTDIIQDNLSLALVNDIYGQIKPVEQADWPMIETKISDILMNYLLDTDCSIPHYDAGEICRGFFIIKCEDQFSKEFICRCVEKVRNAFKNMSLTLVPTVLIPKILDNPIHFDDFDQKIEQPSTYAWTSNTDEQDKTACQKNQGFQLSMNYFNSNCELSRESPLNCVPYDPDECNSLTATDIYQNSENLIDSKKRKKIKKSYKHSKHYLRQMANVKKLSPCQERQILKAKKIIREYERVYGSYTQDSHLQRQQQTSNTNEFSKNNSLRYCEPEMERGGSEFGENSSCDWNDFDPGMQEMSIANNIFDNTGNYDCPRSGFPLYTNNYLDSVMDPMPELPLFAPNLESFSNMTDNSDFNSCFNSKFKEMANEDPKNSRNFGDPEEENFNGRSKIIPNFEKTFFQPASQTVPQHEYPEETSFMKTRGNPIKNDLSSQFASTSKNIFPSFSEQQLSPTANSSSNIDKTDYPYSRRNNMSTNPETSSNVWQEAPANNSNCFEESAKIALEKRIYECLNALSEKDATIEKPSFKRETESYPAVAQLRQKSIALRKETTDHHPTVEVISLTDDSADSDIVEIKSLNEDKAKSEYFQALDYLTKMELRHKESLSKAENLQMQIYRHKVKKYEKMFGSAKTKKSTLGQTDKKRKRHRRSNANENTRKYSSREKVNVSKDMDEQQQGILKSDSDCFIPAKGNSRGFSPPRFPNEITGWCPETTPKTSSTSALTYRSNTNTDLKIAIIDRNQDDGKISREAWLKIEKSLLEQLNREMLQTNNTNIGMFDCTYWCYDIKIIECENIESLNFITRFIHNQDIYWPNTQYDVIPAKELPRRSIVKVWIPPPILNDLTVLRLLKAQNSKFYSLDWTLINSREGDQGNGKNLYISISPTSLDRLRKKNGEIRFGTNRLKMILPEES